MKKRVLSMLMTLALCLTLFPAPAWAAEDTPEGGAIVQQEQQEEAPAEETDTPEIGATVQQEQQEEQQEAPAAEPSAILEQAAENGIAVQDSEDSTVENAVAEVTVNGSTTPYADIDAAFAAAQQADSATVKLLADVTIRHEDYSGIKLEKGNITLDLNGKTLSKSTRDDSGFFARNAVFWLSPPGVTTKDDFLAALKTPVRLTVQDNSTDGNGKIVQPNGGPAVIAPLNTILTVNGGTIENTSSVDLDNDSHMTPNCAVQLSGGGKAVINGGTLRGMRGVAVAGYITKEEEGLYKEHFGIEGYNNDTYGNELTVTGGNICATSGEALIVYEKAKKIELSGGIFTTQSNAYSIWVADTEAEGEPTIKGDASSLLASGYRYEYNGTECAYSEDGKGVAGNATVAPRPANEYAYIDKDGKLTTQANCTEITERTDDISTPGWYVVKENVTISGLNISGEVNLILCDGATLTVTSFMNVTQGSTLNLYWQSAGTGKLTAAAISVLGTVTAPAGEMKQTTGEGGTTFEKCFEHDWGYTNNGDTHTAMCKLCGKAEAAESHKYDSWAPTDANIHTGTCACGATKTEGHTLTCTPNADGLTHSTKCSVCGYTAAAESHDFNQTDNYGKKCACGAYLAAECNGQQYATLARAIEAANGADITLLTIVSENVVVDGASIKAGIILGNGKTIDDIPYPSNWVADSNGIPLTMEAGEITLKDGALAQFTGYASANNAIALKGGTLTVADTVTKIIGSVASESGQRAAIEATGGVLDLQGNTLLDGGLTMSGDAQLKNKLTAGTFTNSGSETYSVSVEGSSQYTTVFDLLETGYAFAVYNEDAPTGDVIAKDTTTRELTEDVAVIKCTHKGANNKSLFKDNTCTGCGFTCAHETVENGVCTVCKQQMKAKASASDGTEQYYLDLQEAFEGVADGGTVTMLTTLTDDDTISFCCDAEGNPVEKTVTLMMNGHSLSYEGASSLNIQSGKLIIGDEVTISQPATAAVPAVFVDNNEQSKDRGTLEFKGKANLTGGLLIQNWGKLEGGLKEGTIITSNGTYSVSVERSETYSNVLGLLGDGLAFAKKDHPDELVNGNVKQLTEDVIVVAHTHSMKCAENPNQDAFRKYIYRCDCGFVCPHEHFTNSICDTCHAACTHDEDDGFGSCAYCGAPFAVRVEHTDGVGLTSNKLYMKTTAQDGTDDTLQQVFNEAADGSTVTLLVDGLRASGEVTGKTITLDLNGHSLSGYSLNVGGLTATSQVRTGNLTVIDSSGGNGAVGVTVRDGGTLVFDPKNDSTTLLQLEVWGGTVELYGGKISRSGLRLNNSITLGDLLPQKAGLAYYCGDTQLTLEEAASKTCDLVVKSCTHGDKNGFDKNATACPYCNAPAVAETDLNDGKGSRLRRRFANLQTAIDADRDGGATLQLLADVTGDYTIDGTRDTRLDLNGHCIKGTVTVKTATGNNTTTFSNTQNTTTAGIDVVVAYKGAKLAGSNYPAVISRLTLADTTKWKDILQQTTNIGFMVTNTDGTHTWYAPDDVKGSQLNNVIINYDKAAPDWSGSESGIRIKSTWWNKLLSSVTFGLYKSSSLDVYAKANDSLSGVAEYYYYIDNSGSTTTLTAEELANKSFTKVAADKNGTTKLTEITSDNNYVIYAYAVDAAGNRSAYISSDGVVLDNTAPELTNVSTPAKSNGTLSDTSATITFNGSEAGTYYYILKEDGNTAPTQMSDFATKTAGDKVDTWTAKEGVSTGTLAADEANTIILTGLKAHTSYVLYLAATDTAGNASVVETKAAAGNSGIVSVSFTTTKTIPYVKTAPVLSGTYGDTVSAMLKKADKTKAVVTAGRNSDTKVAGTWSLASEDADKLPTVGTSEKCTLVFTPEGSDADTYDSVTCEVTPEVSKKQITIVIADKEKFYGEANPALTWSLATGDVYADNVLVAGDTEEALGISLSTTAKDNSNVGTYAITGLSDSANYEVSFSGSGSDGKSGVMTVKQAAEPTIAGEEKSYAYSVGSDGKTIGVDIAGKLPIDRGTTTYTVAMTDTEQLLSEVTVDTAGNLTYKVNQVDSSKVGKTAIIIVTASMENYANAGYTLTISITDKKTVEIKRGNSVSVDGSNVLIYGEKISKLTLGNTVFVEAGTDDVIEGILSWSNPDEIPAAGTTQAGWVFKPVDSKHYEDLTGTAAITVARATPAVVTVPTVAERVYNPAVALADSDMTGGSVTGADGNSLAGTWSFTGTNIIPAVNNKGYQAVFTPNDTNNYNTVTRTITVKVTKATPVIAEKPTAGALTYGQKLLDSTLTGGKAAYQTADGTEITGAFAWKNSSIKPTVADSGKTECDVTFTPSDTANYNAVGIKLSLTVNKAAKAPNMPETTMTPAHSTKKVGDITLPDGWSWQEADRDTALADGVAVTATAVYTGADKGNYETESVSITITRSKCDHTHTEIRNQQEATCKKEGYTGDTYCKDCGEKLATGTATVKKAHTVGTPATCVSKAVCSVCSETFGEVDATNHVHTTVKNRKEATCTQTGYTGDTYCTDCNKLLGMGKELAALGHEYKATVTKQPTTTEEGIRTYTCTRCNSSYTESIAKLPEEKHTHNYTGSITKEATCTEAGVRTYTCSCGDSYTESIPATGHSYVSKVTKAATTTEEGIMTYTCSKCGHSYTQPIAMIKSDNSNKDNGKDNGTSIKPYIKDDSGKEGWDVIKQQLEEAKAGDTVTVAMNGTTVVPKDVIDSIKGKDTTLVLDMGNGLSWKINGKEITDAAGDIDFDVTVGADAGKSIPVDVINNVTGERSSLNLTLAYDGEFGFIATLTVNMESKNAGLYANLFYYNEQTGELEFISAGQIDPEGNVELVFTHASDYTIVVDAKIMSDNGQADNKSDETIPAHKTDDSTSKYAWNNTIIIIIGICIILIVFGAVFYVRKKSGSEEE